MKPILRLILAVLLGPVLDLAVLAIAIHHVVTMDWGSFAPGWAIGSLAALFVPAVFSESRWAPIGCWLAYYLTLAYAHPSAVDSAFAAIAVLFLAAVPFWAIRLTRAVRAVRARRRLVKRLLGKRRDVKLIGLSGYARTGKDTAAAALVDQGWHRIAVADKLKAIAYDLNPWVNTTNANMIRLRDLVDRAGWEEAKKHADVRDLLQRLGVACRDHIDTNVWVAAALKDLPADQSVVITDCRFPNEVVAVESLGGTMVRLERDGIAAVNAHSSESALDDFAFKYTIRNNSSVETLSGAIRYVGDRIPGRY